MDKIKLEEMNKNYRQLLSKVNEYKWKEEAVESQFVNKRINMIDKEKEKENLEMYLLFLIFNFQQNS